MGRAKVPKVKGTASAAAPEEKEDREPVRVKNLYEAGALKGALDDVAREVVLDAGYEEDVFITNTKIILGVAAISAALYAQFGPGKFPSTWWTVFGCVVAYLILTLAMNLFTSKMEGDAFLVTRPFRGCKGLRVCSRLPRYSDQYSLALVDRSDPSLEVISSFTIPNYFHADGYLAEAAWRAEVDKLIAAFSQRHSARTAKKNE